ncbi:MAG: LPXTG cell wall anchor domain-containing protein [Aeromicrobium sp.]
MLLVAFAGPATSEGYGDPAIVPDAGDGRVAVEPGEPFSVSFSSNVECSWSARFNDDSAPGAVGFDFTASFDAPTDPGTYEGTVVCRYSTSGPFRPIAYSADATQAAARDQVTTQTFTVVVDGDTADDASAGEDSGAAADNGALADTGGSNWEVLALGAGLVVIGAGAAVAARRRKSS